MTDLDKPEQTSVNDSGTDAGSDAWLTPDCSCFDPTPESKGATAALLVKAEAQGAIRFFDDTIHIRRDLIAKREAVGADTALGHTCSNIIEILENLFGYERPAWAIDVRQTLPWMMNQQIKRLERLTSETA